MRTANDFPLLMTPTEVAIYLGVPVEAIAIWLREGKLLAAARGENGLPLIYRWRVERDGPELSACEPVRLASSARAGLRQRRKTLLIDPFTLACGCSFAGAPAQQPIFLCGTARALDASAQLAQAFVAVAPHDPFFTRLAAVTGEAIAAHFAGDHSGRVVDPRQKP